MNYASHGIPSFPSSKKTNNKYTRNCNKKGKIIKAKKALYTDSKIASWKNCTTPVTHQTQYAKSAKLQLTSQHLVFESQKISSSHIQRIQSKSSSLPKIPELVQYSMHAAEISSLSGEHRQTILSATHQNLHNNDSRIVGNPLLYLGNNFEGVFGSEHQTPFISSVKERHIISDTNDGISSTIPQYLYQKQRQSLTESPMILLTKDKDNNKI